MLPVTGREERWPLICSILEIFGSFGYIRVSLQAYTSESRQMTVSGLRVSHPSLLFSDVLQLCMR